MRRFAFCAACAFLAAAQSDEVRVSAHAYAPPSLNLTAQAQLVQLDVVVRDARGHAVAGLQQSDFEILDEGSPRPIAAFSVETRGASPEAPRTVAASAASASNSTIASTTAPSTQARRFVMLFFDDIHAGTGELRRSQNAAIYFVKHNLAPGLFAAVYAASEGLTLDFTNDADKLSAAIDRLRSHVRVSESGLSPCPRITPYQAFVIFNNIDPSAMVAAVSEAHACDAADTRISNVYAGGAVRPGALSKVPQDQLSIVVQQQSSQTWEMARVATMQSYDALAAAIGRLTPLPGTRVLLLVSEGFLSGLEEERRMQEVIDSAVRGGVVINGLDAKGLWAEPPARPLDEVTHTIEIPTATFIFEATTIGARNSALNSTISEMATATGGLFFHNSNDLNGGFELLGAVPETTYLMAFRPDPQEATGKYRKLKVRLVSARRDYVETRPGYFAPTAAPSETSPRGLDREALADDAPSDFPVQLAGRLGKTDKGALQLTLVIHVDLSKLAFTESDGRHRQRLEFIGALMNAKGEMAAAKEGSMEFALKDDTLTRLTASGVNASLSLSAPPGPYRVRVVVQDAGGKMAALNQTVRIPE